MKQIYSQIKKVAWKIFILGGIGLMIVGLILIFGVCHRLFSYWFISAPDLFETKSQYFDDGDWYTCDNNILFDYFASDDSGRYYITNTNDGEYFGFYVRNQDLEIAEQICDETYDYMDGKRDDLPEIYLKGKGYLVAMNNSEQRFLRDYIQATGGEVEDYKLVYYTFRLEHPWSLVVDDQGESNIFYVIVGICLIVLGIYMIIHFISGGYKKPIRKSMKEYGILEEILDKDMQTAKNIGCSFIGNEHVVFYTVPGSCVIPYNTLVWMYVQITNTKHTVYGIIPAGTTKSYQLVIFNRNKKKIMINVRSEEQGNEIIQEMYGRAPYFLRGFNDKFADAVNNNFNSLLQAVDERRHEVLGGGY